MSKPPGRPALVYIHLPHEHAGLIGEALAQVGIGLEVRCGIALEPGEVRPARVQPAAGPFPDLDRFSAVVVMGGPMNADETARYPTLALERRVLAEAVRRGVPALGVCLGHQMVARALGAPVEPGAKEIGFAPVDVVARAAQAASGAQPGPGPEVPAGTDPAKPTPDVPLDLLRGLEETPVLHWHGDRAELPAGATLLARSGLTPNQAFAYGSAVGLQFHVEVGRAVFGEWMADATMRAEADAAGVSDIEAQGAVLASAEPVYRRLLAGWARWVAARDNRRADGGRATDRSASPC
jgi:GMP synthase (glutamine-hydrolysing)